MSTPDPMPAGNTPDARPGAPASTPAVTLSSTLVLTRALKLAGILTIALIIVGGVVGYFVDSWTGVLSAVIGAAMAFVFLGITAASILIANRSYSSPLYTVMFFAIVLGSWLVKFVIFIVVALLLRNQPFIDKYLLFGFLIVGVIMTLVIDVVVVARTRLPYVSDATLPK
ncbi:MAG: conserved rane protein [Subtercola sp.]|nr:conserved rane protein [Subtercola sp.]